MMEHSPIAVVVTIHSWRVVLKPQWTGSTCQLSYKGFLLLHNLGQSKRYRLDHSWQRAADEKRPPGQVSCSLQSSLDI